MLAALDVRAAGLRTPADDPRRRRREAFQATWRSRHPATTASRASCRRRLLNYLVRLGWSHGDQEIFSVDEMIALFDISEVNQSASAFNPEKLLWLNQQHIIAAPADELGAQPGAVHSRAAGLEPANGPPPAGRGRGLSGACGRHWCRWRDSARYLYEDFTSLRDERGEKAPAAGGAGTVARRYGQPSPSSRPGSRADHRRRDRTRRRSVGLGLGKLGQPIRVAVTGTGVSPPIDVTSCISWRERAVARLARALDYIMLGQRQLPDPARIRPVARFLDSLGPRPYSAAAPWGYSSAGRALAWHARGRRFDPA